MLAEYFHQAVAKLSAGFRFVRCMHTLIIGAAVPEAAAASAESCISSLTLSEDEVALAIQKVQRARELSIRREIEQAQAARYCIAIHTYIVHNTHSQLCI
jgi:hypothetical protein